LKSSTGSGAEPEKASLSEEMSAFTGRCIRAEMAVGTVMTKVTLCRSTSLPEAVHHPLAPVALGRGQDDVRARGERGAHADHRREDVEHGSGQIMVSCSVNRSRFATQPL
jgi:hypothetical protein